MGTSVFNSYEKSYINNLIVKEVTFENNEKRKLSIKEAEFYYL